MKKNINLKNKNLSRKSLLNASLSTNLGTIVLALTFLVFGIFFIMNTLVQKNIVKVDQAAQSMEDSLTSGQFDEVYDFGVKLIDLDNQIGDEDFLPQTKNLLKISEKTFNEVVFYNLSAEYKNGFSHYSIELRVPDYKTLANQVKVYKEADDIYKVVLTDIKEDAEDGITASIDFDLGDSNEIFKESSTSEENF